MFIKTMVWVSFQRFVVFGLMSIPVVFLQSPVSLFTSNRSKNYQPDDAIRVERVPGIVPMLSFQQILMKKENFAHQLMILSALCLSNSHAILYLK